MFPTFVLDPNGPLFSPKRVVFCPGECAQSSHTLLEMIKRERFLMCTSFRTGTSVAWRTTVDSPGRRRTPCKRLPLLLTIEMSKFFYNDGEKKNRLSCCSTINRKSKKSKKLFISTWKLLTFWLFQGEKSFGPINKVQSIMVFNTK